MIYRNSTSPFDIIIAGTLFMILITGVFFVSSNKITVYVEQSWIADFQTCEKDLTEVTNELDSCVKYSGTSEDHNNGLLWFLYGVILTIVIFILVNKYNEKEENKKKNAKKKGAKKNG